MTRVHNLQGNCWDDEATDAGGDICDEHDEMRGDCDECPICGACEAGE